MKHREMIDKMTLEEKAALLSGKWYTNENIDQMLMERHLAKKARNAKKKHHLKGPAKRTEEDDQRFEVSLEKLIVYIDMEE